MVRQNIIILGGGFAGSYTAIYLERLLKRQPEVQVTLVSRDNFYLMTPLLFEAGSGTLEPRHVVNPIRPLLKRTRFVEAVVDRVDLEQRVVEAYHGRADQLHRFQYDHLVFALGGVPNTEVVPGSEQVLPFKSLADAIRLRNHTIDQFELAAVESDHHRRSQLLTFVIIGAGLVGVELCGELTHFLESLCRSYDGIEPTALTVHLIEAGGRIAPEFDPKLSDYAAKVLHKRGVDIRLKRRVTRAEAGRVILDDGDIIVGGTIIYAGGLAPNPLLKTLAIEKDKHGKIVVEGYLRAQGRDDVWALGDCAAIPDGHGKVYPALAQHALREAKQLAKNLAGSLYGAPPAPFVYTTLGTMALLGKFTGMGKILGVRVRGFFAWWIWRSYYLLQMPQLERKLRIIIDWTISLFFRSDIAELDISAWQPPPPSVVTSAKPDGGEGRAAL